MDGEDLLSLPTSTLDAVYRYHTHPKFLPFPSKYISIRGSTDEEKYIAIDVTRIAQGEYGFHVLEEIDISRALFEIYEGAVVSHSRISRLPC